MLPKLTAQEEEALQAVYKTGEGNIKRIMEYLPGDLPYTTVASTIKNLEKKGYLLSRVFGNTYVYKPAMSEEEYKKGFLNEVVKSYFDSSYKALVNFFIEQKKLSPNELKEIVDLIEKKKK